MEIEAGVIWVYGIGEDRVLAFTDFGIENLIELVRLYKKKPGWLYASAEGRLAVIRGSAKT
jgi:hypothetical protein